MAPRVEKSSFAFSLLCFLAVAVVCVAFVVNCRNEKSNAVVHSLRSLLSVASSILAKMTPLVFRDDSSWSSASPNADLRGNSTDCTASAGRARVPARRTSLAWSLGGRPPSIGSAAPVSDLALRAATWARSPTVVTNFRVGYACSGTAGQSAEP